MDVNPTVELKNLPAPPGWPVMGPVFQLKPEHIHLAFEAWARTYGPYYRVQIARKQVLVISDPQGILHVLKERPATFRRLDKMESVMEDMGVTGVVSAEGERWKRQSRLMMQAFNPAYLRGFFPKVLTITQGLLKRWQHAASQNQPIDVQSDLMRYTLDVIASLSLGSDINTLEGDSPVIRYLNRIFPMIQRRVNSIVPYWRYVKLPNDRSFDRDLKALHQAIDEFIAQARARLKAAPTTREQPADFLEALVAARDAANFEFTDEDVFGNVFSILLSGGDGPANMIAWIVYLLCENPEWQQKLQAEVGSLLSGRSILNDFDQLAHSSPWVDAVVQEAMRLKAVFPVLLHQANETTSIDRVRVPAGTPIVLLVRMAGFDPSQFPNPERFDPTRWMPSGDSKVPSIPYLPFGFGLRVCPGRFLAMQEIRMILMMLVQNFAFERGDQAVVHERLKFSMEPTRFLVTLKERHAAPVPVS